MKYYISQLSTHIPSTGVHLECANFQSLPEVFWLGGGCMAYSYANLFMVFLEQDFLFEKSLLPLLGLRIIDDTSII